MSVNGGGDVDRGSPAIATAGRFARRQFAQRIGRRRPEAHIGHFRPAARALIQWPGSPSPLPASGERGSNPVTWGAALPRRRNSTETGQQQAAARKLRHPIEPLVRTRPKARHDAKLPEHLAVGPGRVAGFADLPHRDHAVDIAELPVDDADKAGRKPGARLASTARGCRSRDGNRDVARHRAWESVRPAPPCCSSAIARSWLMCAFIPAMRELHGRDALIVACLQQRPPGMRGPRSGHGPRPRAHRNRAWRTRRRSVGETVRPARPSRPHGFGDVEIERVEPFDAIVGRERCIERPHRGDHVIDALDVAAGRSTHDQPPRVTREWAHRRNRSASRALNETSHLTAAGALTNTATCRPVDDPSYRLAPCGRGNCRGAGRGDGLHAPLHRARPRRREGDCGTARRARCGATLLDTADAYCLDETETGHNERLIAAVARVLDGRSVAHPGRHQGRADATRRALGRGWPRAPSRRGVRGQPACPPRRSPRSLPVARAGSRHVAFDERSRARVAQA